MKAVVEAAGLDLSHMVFVNPYLTAQFPMRMMNEHYARRFEFGNTPARATIEVSSLPNGAQIEYTGVAVRDLATTAGRASQEHAAQPHGESVRLCRRYVVLFREEWFHPRTERRSLYFYDSPPASSDDAQPVG